MADGTHNYQSARSVTVTTTGNIDDLDVDGAGMLVMNNASAAVIRGIDAGYHGQILVIVAIGAGAVDVNHQDTNSAAANRIITNTAAAVSLPASGVGAVVLQYDGVTARWRSIAFGNAALLNAANVFTANQRINASLGVNVAPGAAGEIKTSAGLYERSRSVALGEGINEAFSAGDFTANGAMTWTLTSGDMVANRYMLLGKLMIWFVTLTTTSVGGVVDTTLRMTIPDGILPAVETNGQIAYCTDNGTLVDAFVTVRAGQSYAEIRKKTLANWTASANNTEVYFTMLFEVQ